MDTFKSIDEPDVMRNKKRMKKTHADFVADGLPTVEIRQTIMKIRDFVKANNGILKTDNELSEKAEKEFPFFAKRYPMLFAMACKAGEFDFESLEYFLNMRDNIIDNKMTSEEASKQVGEVWFNKYVDLSKMENKSI